MIVWQWSIEGVARSDLSLNENITRICVLNLKLHDTLVCRAQIYN